MKREEILNKKNSEKEVVNVAFILKKDVASVNSIKSAKELELIEIEDKIESFLKNEGLRINLEFIAIVKEKDLLESDLEIIEKIKKEYL